MSERDCLLRRIQAVDFALYETVLYLNGHPHSKKALAFYNKHREMAKALREEFECKHGPLTVYGNRGDCSWNWTDHPWPWEKEAN